MQLSTIKKLCYFYKDSMRIQELQTPGKEETIEITEAMLSLVVKGSKLLSQ